MGYGRWGNHAEGQGELVCPMSWGPLRQDPRGKDTTLGKADLLEPLHAGLQTLGSAYDHVSCKSEASTVCEWPCLHVALPSLSFSFPWL